MINRKLVLASNSPRRKELLKGLDLKFEVRVIDGIDESFPSGLPANAVPAYIAENKADAYLSTLKENEVLITADTVVIIKGEILEKPANSEDATKMLKRLSGNKHDVVTAVVLSTLQKRKVFSVTSTVDFAELTDDEIKYYVDKYKPFDKAGAYGIQEWIGYIGVQGIKGSFHNVMGLPVQRLYQELKNF
jgi:septum formation protein